MCSSGEVYPFRHPEHLLNLIDRQDLLVKILVPFQLFGQLIGYPLKRSRCWLRREVIFNEIVFKLQQLEVILSAELNRTLELVMIAVCGRHPSGSFDTFVHDNDRYFAWLHSLLCFRIAEKVEVGTGEHKLFCDQKAYSINYHILVPVIKMSLN